MPTSLFPLSISLTTVGGESVARLPFYQDATLFKVQVSLRAILSGELDIAVYRNDDTLIDTLVTNKTGTTEKFVPETPFTDGDLVRVDVTGTATGISDCYLTLWFRMQIS